MPRGSAIWVVTLLVGAATLSAHESTWALQGAVPAVRVYNINIRMSWPDYAGRVGRAGTMMAVKDNERERTANLFVLTEAFSEPSREVDGLSTGLLAFLGLPVVVTYQIPKARPVPCGGVTGWTHECLYEGWIGGLDPALREEQGGAFGGQHGEVAVMAETSGFERASTEIVEENICSGIAARRKTLIGVRLRIKGTDDVLPVYAVHLVAGPSWRQRWCVEDLLVAIQRHWVHGDLTPLVIGDFNFTSNARRTYGKIAGHFTEAGRAVSGHDGIEQAWVGMPTSPYFPGNAGALVPLGETWDQGAEFRRREEGEPGLTDHDVPFLEFWLPGDQQDGCPPMTDR